MKKRISLLLTIVGDGTELAPVLILKKKGFRNFSFWYENIFLSYEKKIKKMPFNPRQGT